MAGTLYWFGSVQARSDTAEQPVEDDLQEDDLDLEGEGGEVDGAGEDNASDEELVDAGLAKWSRRGTLYDVFRERLVFGLHDTHGDLVGFVGRRAPGNEDGPKYLNTPETDIFHKRAVLFGLHEGHDAVGVLLLVRQVAFNQQVGNLIEGGVICQFSNIVATVTKDALLTVNKGNLGLGGASGGVAGVEGNKPGFLAELGDIEAGIALSGLLDIHLVLVASVLEYYLVFFSRHGISFPC